jgi:hypothetical protein
MEFNRLLNLDSDAEVRTKAKKHILREYVRITKRPNRPSFTEEEVRNRLEGYFPNFFDINISELFRGSGLVEIDVNDNLTLNRNGRESCKKGETPGLDHYIKWTNKMRFQHIDLRFF